VSADDHRHCKVCGKVVDPGEETCSKACRAKREQLAQTRRTYTYLIYGAILLLVIVLLASEFFR
jgi:predicted nucleic acid-binding Zn ribbon protein